MEQVKIDKDAVEFIASNARGPYRHSNGESGYWHKEGHTGAETCVGCAVEEALNNTAP